MKKKFISVAMLCTLAVSAPLFVGCSDYDDDISNLQSQIDGLKTSVPTNEALSALQEALNSAKQDLETVKAGKADAQAVKELEEKVKELSELIGSSDDGSEIGNLSQQIQDLIEQVNDIDGDLQTKYNEWVKEKDALKSQIEDLNKQIASAATDEEVKTLKESLEAHVKEWNEISTKVEEAAKWVENNGAAIAELTNEVNNIQGIIDAIYGTEGSTVDSKKILAAITALPSYTDQLTALQKQINEGDDSVVQQLASLDQWKTTVTNALIENGFKTQDGAADINSALKILADINKQLNTADENDLTFVDHLNNALKELESLSLLATQVQSIVFVPSSIETPYTIKSEKLILVDASDKEDVVGVKTENTIKFRISPAKAVTDFDKKYELVFDGQPLTKSAVSGLETTLSDIDEEEGTVTYQITKAPEVGKDQKGWAVCAKLKAKEEKDDQGNVKPNNGTDISSNYFVISNEETAFKNLYMDAPSTGFDVEYKPTSGTGNYTLDLNKAFEGKLYGNVSTVRDNDGKFTSWSVTPEIVAINDYGVSASLAFTPDEADKDVFTIDQNNILSPKTAGNSQIGKSATYSMKFTINGKEYSNPDSEKFEVTIVGRSITVDIANTFAPEGGMIWKSTDQILELPESFVNEVIDQTDLRTDDLFNDLTLVTDDSKDYYLTTGKALGSSYDSNRFYLVVKGGKEIPANAVCTMKFEQTGSTRSESYTVNIKVAATDYTKLGSISGGLVKAAEKWDGNNVTLNLNVNSSTNKLNKSFQISDMYSNLTDLVKAANEVGATIKYEIASNVKPAGSVTLDNSGVLTFEPGGALYDYTKTPNVKVKVSITFGNGTNAKLYAESEGTYTINKTISGTWTSLPKASTGLSLSDMKGKYEALEGISWKDYKGDKLIWWNTDNKNGALGYRVENALSATYGFSEPIVGFVHKDGTDNNVLDEEGYLKINSEGQITFEEKGKNTTFTKDYTTTVRVRVSTRWSQVTGIESGYQDIKVTIKAGAHQ